MKKLIRFVIIVLGIFLGAIAAAAAWWSLGFSDEVDGTHTFEPSSMPADLDKYLADSERDIPNLRPNVEKRIVWNGAAGDKTEWAVVYLHGYSATSEEVRPVPDMVASSLGANLYFTRLKGHGRDGDAMAEPTGADWIADTAEAMEIGRRIGEKVIVLGTSTGGTLAAIAAADEGLQQNLSGVVLISPNFKIFNPMAGVLTLPGVRWWGPVVAGETRSFEPRNDMQAQYWTTSYPTVSTVSLAHLVRFTSKLDYEAISTPALFMFSDDDQVVVPETTRGVASRWGGDTTLVTVEMGAGDDESSHVIAGDIVSPGQTDRAVETILEWVKDL